MVERQPRSIRLRQITKLIDAGLTRRQIATELGMTLSGVHNVLGDPDGSKQKARHNRYRRPCPKCGKPMSGSAGWNGKGKPQQCAACRTFEARSKPTEHGTRNGYSRGCRCRPCRDGMAKAVRLQYAKKRPPKKPDAPERRRAYDAVQRAIQDGAIIVPNGCERCSAEDRGTYNGRRWIQAHHDDYSHPLDVTFLCVPCHRAVHKEARVAA